MRHRPLTIFWKGTRYHLESRHGWNSSTNVPYRSSTWWLEWAGRPRRRTGCRSSPRRWRWWDPHWVSEWSAEELQEKEEREKGSIWITTLKWNTRHELLRWRRNERDRLRKGSLFKKRRGFSRSQGKLLFDDPTHFQGKNSNRIEREHSSLFSFKKGFLPSIFFFLLFFRGKKIRRFLCGHPDRYYECCCLFFFFKGDV